MIRLGEEICSNLDFSSSREWLETNGIGGFASATITGCHTRRYHGLLVAATKPPVGRFVLLSKLEETLIVDDRRIELGTNHYPGVVHPQGYHSLKEFRLEPFPTFTFAVGIAPVIERSGKKKWVHFRWAAPKFLRQSFHEWAGRSITQSHWARSYYEQQRQRGKGHHAAVRALAFKWIRIAFRCWKDCVAYDESRYLATLVRRACPLSASMAASTLAKTL
jgi:Glycogen debranching enzyme N terminal